LLFSTMNEGKTFVVSGSNPSLYGKLLYCCS
jgi:hypothetical protein